MDIKIKGGNCDIIIDKNNKTATKKLRNTSSKEKIVRFKQELQIIKLKQARIFYCLQMLILFHP